MRTKWKVTGWDSTGPTSEFAYIDTLSNKDAIIYISNKYKDKLLFNDFLKKNKDYSEIAEDLGINGNSLFMYFTYRLGINNITNKLDEWKYSSYYATSEADRKKSEKEKEKILKEQVFYTSRHIWKLLAYYCKFHSYKQAKSVLKDIQRYHFSHIKLGWNTVIKKRLQEIFTPMLFPTDDYKLANMIICKVLKKEKKGIYKGELINYGQKEDDLFKLDQHYTPECLIITKNKDSCDEIDKIMKKERVPVAFGMRSNPKRNIINEIIKIKDTKNGSLKAMNLY